MFDCRVMKKGRYKWDNKGSEIWEQGAGTLTPDSLLPD
jgi:hypothetical protein